MKLENIANFSGNIVTFAALPALIFFNYSAVLFFLNEWQFPFLFIAAALYIFAIMYYAKKRAYPNKSASGLLLILTGATCSAAFYNPYPDTSLISISGFYNEKDGAWVSSNTDENTQDILGKIKDTWNQATSKENPSFRFAEPFAIETWQFPTLFLTHRSKQQIIKLAEENSDSAVILVGFTRDGKLDTLHYSLNKKAFQPNTHGVIQENKWFNLLLSKIIDNPTLSDSHKREIIAKILFIDFNARALSVRATEMDYLGMANLVVKTQDEVIALQNKYPFIKDELNYLIAGLTASLIDVYKDQLPEEKAADLLIQALSYYPYYPYSDKESFQRAYVKSSYTNWRLSNDSEDDVTLINELLQITNAIKDPETKRTIINDFKNYIFLTHASPVMFYYMLEMIKTIHPLLETPLKDVGHIREWEEYTDNFLRQHTGMDDDFIDLKSTALYSVYYFWFTKVNRKKDAARVLKKIENITNYNPNIVPFLIKINKEEKEAQH